MSLRALAEADLAATLEAPGDWGWPVKITAPDGTEGSFHAQTQDVVEQLLDPDTGQGVNLRTVSCTLRTTALQAVFGDALPEQVLEGTGKPWVFEFADGPGKAYCWTVRRSRPDRTLGVHSLILESWSP